MPIKMKDVAQPIGSPVSSQGSVGARPAPLVQQQAPRASARVDQRFNQALKNLRRKSFDNLRSKPVARSLQKLEGSFLIVKEMIFLFTGSK